MKTICPHCNYEYPEVDDNLLGQEVECTNCKEIFVVDQIKFDRQIDIKPQKSPNAHLANCFVDKKNKTKKCVVQITLNCFGWLELLSAMFFFAGAVWLAFNDKAKYEAIFHNISITAICLLGAVFFFAVSKIVGLLMQIEENTRKN